MNGRYGALPSRPDILGAGAEFMTHSGSGIGSVTFTRTWEIIFATRWLTRIFSRRSLREQVRAEHKN